MYEVIAVEVRGYELEVESCLGGYWFFGGKYDSMEAVQAFIDGYNWEVYDFESI